MKLPPRAMYLGTPAARRLLRVLRVQPHLAMHLVPPAEVMLVRQHLRCLLVMVHLRLQPRPLGGDQLARVLQR